jgi:hypothetical protein
MSEPGVAVGSLDGGELFQSQVQRDQLADIGFVLDDQNVWWAGM